MVFQRKAERAFFTKKNLNLDEGNVNFGDKVVVSHFNSLVTDNVSSNPFFAF